MKKKLNDFLVKSSCKFRTSETTRVTSLTEENFNFWLAGFIDGNGCFYEHKQNYIYSEIRSHAKEIQIIHKIKKHVGGGSATTRTDQQTSRHCLYKKQLIFNLLNLINGKLRLELRIKQFSNLCDLHKVQIKPKNRDPLITNAWASGLFESDGSFLVNRKTFQCTIHISQKTKEVLDEIQKEFGGGVYWNESWDGHYYQATSKEDLHKWLAYFDKFNLKGTKNIQLKKFKRLIFFKENKYIYKRNFRPRILKLVKSFYKVKNPRMKI